MDKDAKIEKNNDTFTKDGEPNKKIIIALNSSCSRNLKHFGNPKCLVEKMRAQF